MLNTAIWPTLDYGRVPYRLYHDPETYQCEQERIFRGPTWNFLGLEAGDLKFRDKLVRLDTFAVPSLLATPL